MSLVSGVSGDFAVSLSTRLPDWSAGALLRCTALLVCPCVVSFSEIHEPDTHDLLRTSRWHPRGILVPPVRFLRDTLATFPRRCHEDAIRGNCSRGISALNSPPVYYRSLLPHISICTDGRSSGVISGPAIILLTRWRRKSPVSRLHRG